MSHSIQVRQASNTPRNIVTMVLVTLAGVAWQFAIKAGAAALVQATAHTPFWLTLGCLYVVPWAVRSAK